MVLLRAKHNSAAVLKVFFWTPDILFNIDLGLMTTETKGVNILKDKLRLTFNSLIWPFLAHPSLVFRKKVTRKSVGLT